MDHSVFGYLKRQPTEKLLQMLMDNFSSHMGITQSQVVYDVVEILLLRGQPLPAQVLRWYADYRRNV